jgi:ATP-dependent DNA helicase RecG
LERLVEAGLVEPQGIKKGRTYTLSASLYRQMGQSADYIRQVGFDRIQQEQMVIQYIRKHGQIKRKDVMDLCRLSRDQATRLLQHMLAEKKLSANGQSRGTYYTLP